jgi:hypothetical protein
VAARSLKATPKRAAHISMPDMAIETPSTLAVSNRFCPRWRNGLLRITPGKIRWLKCGTVEITVPSY